MTEKKKSGAAMHIIGAVLCVEGNFLYPIEGNSGGRVAVHRYDLNDQRIEGYGVQDRKTQGETTE